MAIVSRITLLSGETRDVADSQARLHIGTRGAAQHSLAGGTDATAGFSQANFTQAEKTKLEGIPTGGGGTVTSVSGNNGLEGTVTTSGNIGIANSGVTTARIADNAVTAAKILNVGRMDGGLSIGTGTNAASASSVAIGHNARAPAGDCICIGRFTNSNECTGAIALGANAEVNLGASHIAIGHNSYVGYLTGSTPAPVSPSIAIGTNAHATHLASAILTPSGATIDIRRTNAANRILLGFPGINVAGFSAWNNVSDERDKTDITELSYDPYKFINALKPCQYRLDFRSDYEYFEEISEENYEKLANTIKGKYYQLHHVITCNVFGIEGTTDIEWVNNSIFQDDRDTGTQKGIGGYVPEINRTRFIKNPYKSEEAALATYKQTDQFKQELKRRQDQAVRLKQEAETKNQTRLELLKVIEDAQATGIDCVGAYQELATLGDFENVAIEIPEDFDPPIIEVRKARFLRKQAERDQTFAGKRFHGGLLGQEVEKAAEDQGFDFAGVKKLDHNKDENGIPTGDDMYNLAYEELWAPMIAAFQQLCKKVEELQHVQDENEDLKKKVEDQEKRLERLEALIAA